MPCFEKLALGPGARGAAVQKACEERFVCFVFSCQTLLQKVDFFFVNIDKFDALNLCVE